MSGSHAVPTERYPSRMQWVDLATDEVIGPGHPDYAFWRDSFEFEEQVARWEAEGQVFKPVPKAKGDRVPSAPQPPKVPAVALCLSREQAAEALSVGVDWFDAHVKPHIRVIAKGRRVLVPVAELERYVNENAARALR